MTQAHVIISTEYYLNQPSVFLLHNGNYFGCKIYPAARNYPTNVDYWKSATCSDSDRFFGVYEVNLTQEMLMQIETLQKEIELNNSFITEKSFDYIPKTWKVKRGKAYAAWVKEKNVQEAEIKAQFEKNEPFKAASWVAFDKLRKLFLSLKNN